ncbi:type II toxin-antitoxin system HipA family toxin [Desulfosarcina sp. OttesenSCG-928-A07]|nr:type II toxin-antitoxin system HipA family toxin [Desulfosarcina sp. OttesenSCG-928-G17]MDL2328605.1 type II toxin-antitoxin system HipA family toxin [Desulfosarcina sp. OttesenSCG-928-A07]
MKDKKNLMVQWDGETVGILAPHRKGQVKFSYTPEWIENHNLPVSLSMPCADVSFDSRKSTAFFENFLPEADIYKELCREARIDGVDTYQFLRVFGQECAGALVIFPEGEPPESPLPDAYRDITDDLEAILEASDGIPSSSLMAETQTRLSIGGAQNKLPVVFENERFLVPADKSYAPTTAILKPATASFPNLHRNEGFCMALAREVGLQTPDTEILQIGNHHAYLVTRYDRKPAENGVARIHQEDFCQAMGLGRLYKYEKEGGPGFSACGKTLLHPLISENAVVRESFIRCVLFNYIIGNCDANGKNFSLLYRDKKNVELAPFYDLSSTRVYPEWTKKCAMAIGKTFHIDRIAQQSWKQFAVDMNIRPNWLYELMEEFHGAVASAVEPLATAHEQQYGASPIYESLVDVVKEGLIRLGRIVESKG